MLLPFLPSFALLLNHEIMQFKYAWVWGTSVKHQPQKCGREHVLADEDIVQIVKQGSG